MYRKFIKRILDIFCALLALLVFGWVYIIVAIMVRVKLGKPVIFKQPRPGKKGKDGKEKIFYMYKFRTMTDERDENGKLLPDADRLPKFGAKLRAWSLDEIPEAINILKGDMSVIGPRPQLVRDMVFMSETHRRRHNVRPGLSGLAQISGRNEIPWENKLNVDLEYIENITFIGDCKIIFKTIKKVLAHDAVTAIGQATVDDYGDNLLSRGEISKEYYDKKQEEANNLLSVFENGKY